MASEAMYELPTPIGAKKVVRESMKAFLRRVDTVKELAREGKLKVERENAPLRISDRAFHYAVVLPIISSSLLTKPVLEILNEACVVLRERIAQEDSVLDEEEFVLWKLQSILNRWTSVSMSSRILSPQVFDKLESFSRFLVNTLSSFEAALHGELPDLSQFLQQFGVLKDQLVGMVASACMDVLIVGYEHVAEVVSRLTNIPILWFYTPAMPESRVKAMHKLHERIVDQDHVLEEIFQTLFNPSRFIVKIAMGTSKCPRGSLFLLGPSGVGKTEIARGIVEHLLYDANRFIIIDMSDYAELHVVLSPSGSCEMFNNELQQSIFGRLVEAVRERPYSLILFDKIELAHPSVLSIVHKIVTDGELIDGQRHTVVFSNIIVIMTSEVRAYQLGNSCTCANRSSELVEQFKCNPCRTVRGFFLKGDPIIYLSDVALSEASKISSNIPMTVKKGKAIKSPIDDSVAQVLCNNRSGMEHEHPTIYVDGLVGTNELSFRFETMKAVLRSIDAPSDLRNRPFGSYLLLGLNTLGQIELLKGLAEHMKTADGNTLLIIIDMHNPLYMGLLVEAVKKNPHSVLLFHRVEFADCHSYSTLLKILENGDTLQEEGRSRSELLYRMDGIIFFDPFSLEQREIRRLSMEGPHLNGDGADELLFSLFSIFRKSSDTVCNGGPGDYIVNSLLQALEGTRVN
ncbi:hypothetical protein LguiA_002211 [Lonicera macranthoides]